MNRTPGAIYRETDPSEIVDQTLVKLRSGVPIRTVLTASALAVTRSSDLPRGIMAGRCIRWWDCMPCITSSSAWRRKSLPAGPTTRRPLQ